MKKNFKIEIDWDLLQDIARYYEFPVSVFLLKKGRIPEGTRNDSRLKKIVEFEKRIREIVDNEL